MERNAYNFDRATIFRLVVVLSVLALILVTHVITCAEQKAWYVHVYFMSDGYAYNTTEYNPGDYINIEAHTPIVFDFPSTVELVVTTNEGDRELLHAVWTEDPEELEYYVHRASIKMVAPEDPVMYSGFIETHVGAAIMVEYRTADDIAVDTAYVESSDRSFTNCLNSKSVRSISLQSDTHKR